MMGTNLNKLKSGSLLKTKTLLSGCIYSHNNYLDFINIPVDSILVFVKIKYSKFSQNYECICLYKNKMVSFFAGNGCDQEIINGKNIFIHLEC